MNVGSQVDLGCYEKWEMKTAEMVELMRDILPKWIPEDFLKPGKDKVSPLSKNVGGCSM